MSRGKTDAKLVSFCVNSVVIEKRLLNKIQLGSVFKSVPKLGSIIRDGIRVAFSSTVLVYKNSKTVSKTVSKRQLRDAF
jgi:hypothetical protein